MNEAIADKLELSSADLITDLTKTAIGILDLHHAKYTALEDESRIRQVTTPNNGGCSLTETVTKEGVRTFEYSRPVLVVELAEEVRKTTKWEEGGSKVRLTYESDTGIFRTVDRTDATEIRYSTHTYLRNQFRLPEVQPPSFGDKVRAFLGKLTVRRPS